jgi:hypothetical protein
MNERSRRLPDFEPPGGIHRPDKRRTGQVPNLKGETKIGPTSGRILDSGLGRRYYFERRRLRITADVSVFSPDMKAGGQTV